MIEFDDYKGKRLGELFCMIHFQYTFFRNIKKNETDMITVYGKTIFE